MDQVELSAGDWSARAYLARSFTDRLRGNRALPPGSPVVLRTRSVHSFGQKDPIQIVGLDSNMRVVVIRTLMPNRISLLPSARTIVELPDGFPLPSVEDRMEIANA